MNIKELYSKMDERFPRELSCEWDNDGLMCSPDTSREVKRVLLCLDVTVGALEYAKENGCDLIISHHPFVFRPLSSVTGDNYVAKKVISALSGGISVFSFHTRADCADGGVNDILARQLGLCDTTPFGEGGMGRIGTLKSAMSLADFAEYVKGVLSCDAVSYAGEGEVRRVAVLGGDGKDFIPDAIGAGADTFVSGSISYNAFLDAPEMGINIVEGGHFHTENGVLSAFETTVRKHCPDAEILKYNSLCIKVLA